MALSAVVNPLFNLALIPATEHRFDNGAIGAAISLFLTELVVVTAGFVMVGRLVFDARTARRGLLGVGIAVTMWGAAYGARQVVGEFPSLVAAGLAFVVLAEAVRLFTPEEVALLKDGFARVRDRVPVLRRRGSAAAGAPPPA